MIQVKICGITNLEDALVAVSAGAFALGFNFYRRSPRFIEPEAARRIVEQLHATVLTVGEFVNEGGPEVVARIADTARVAAVQLHGDEMTESCTALTAPFVIKAPRATDEFV